MARRSIKFTELAERMSASGDVITAQGIRSRMSRETLTAGFLLAALAALGCGCVSIPTEEVAPLP